MCSLHYSKCCLLSEGTCLCYDGRPFTAILHLKNVYTMQLFQVSTFCRHKELVVYYITWLKVSTLWCHQKVDKVSTLWWDMSFFCYDLSTFWWHQIVSSFYSHTKCLLYAALPLCFSILLPFHILAVFLSFTITVKTHKIVCHFS